MANPNINIQFTMVIIPAPPSVHSIRSESVQMWDLNARNVRASNTSAVETVLRIKNHLKDRGVNYLLNVGPDSLGRIPGPSVEILREVGRR